MLSAALAASGWMVPVGAQTASQTPEAFRLVPAGAHVVVQFDGPGAIAERFAATNLGAMLASPEAAGIRDGFAALIDTLVTKADEGGVDIEPFVAGLRDYGGRITIAFRMFDPEPGEDARGMVVFSMAPHGDTDLAKLVDEFHRILEEDGSAPPGVLVDLEFGEGLRGLRSADDGGLIGVLPGMVDGHLLIAGGRGFEAELAKLVAGEGRMPIPDDAGIDGSGLWAQADGSLLEHIDQLMQLGGSTEPDAGRIDLPARLEQVMRSLRLGSIERARFSIRPDDEFIVFDYEVTTRSGQPSLAEFLAPDLQGPQPILDLVPRTHPSFTATTIDLDALLDALLEFGSAIAEEDVSRETAATRFRDSTGYDLETDLLGRLTGHFVLFDESAAMFEDETDESEIEVDTSMMALSMLIGLDDAQGMAAMLDGLIRKNGMHIGRKRDQYREVEVFSLPLFGLIEIEYAFLDGAVVFGVGDPGKATVRQVIDMALLRGEGQDLPDWPATVRARIARLPAGWRDLSVSRQAVSTEVALAVLEQAGEQFEDSDDGITPALLDILTTLIELAERFDLTTEVAGLEVRPGRVRARVVY